MAINEPSDSLPLANVFRAANELVAAGLIEDWALGGALAAIYYVEPFTTYDADIFFIPKEKGLTAGVPAIYSHLQSQGWQVEGEHLLVRGFPVQFLAASGLTEEAVREAERIDYEGVPAKVFRAEHLVAIAASVGRAKDKARIEQLLEQAEVDKSYLENVLQRHKLKLPKA
jgi:predicted nucleotidyltransferase